jgi:capsular polysaccharide biosynthesis protein
MLGLGFGLLAEMLDRRVRSRDDISDLLEVPVFAIIDSEPTKNSSKRISVISNRLLKSA